MIVAGFELTSETRRPSFLQDLDRLGARVVELAGLADHDRPRADHQHRADRGVAGHRLAPSRAPRIIETNSLEEIVAVVRSRARLRVVLHRDHRALLHPEALDGAVVQVPVRHHDAGLLEQLRVDAEAVVLRGDLDLPRLEVLDRVVRAAVAELELVGLAAAREAEDLVSETDAEGRQRVDECLRAPRSRRCTARGRPGRSRGRSLGLQRERVLALVVAGTTVTSQPAAARLRRMLCFIPKS